VVSHLAERCDIDYVGVGNGNYEQQHLLVPPMEIEPGFGVQFARRVKQAVPSLAVLAEGRINRPQIGEQALADGSCDLVGMTRALIADPRLPERARRGETERIRECVAYNLCIGRRLRKFPIACVQNPAAGHEEALGTLEPAGASRRVIVVGAGVAGLEAARVAAERGHDVTVLERESEPGGQVRDLARLPLQAPFAELVGWRVAELARLGVAIELGVQCDEATIAARAPDAVIIATGSSPSELAGSIAAVEVVRGHHVDGPVVVLDFEGHRKAAGTAEVLARAGHTTTLVALNGPALGGLVASVVSVLSLGRLRDAGVRLVEGHRLVSVGDGAVTLARIYDGAPLVLEAAAVVHAAPNVADDRLVDALRMRMRAVHAIGDARAPRLVEDAIRDGYTFAAAI
jgi:NADPH-dependent 2,4-dienoyl-CoA reductase/sulfur reductase-like enzyme